MKRLSSVLAMTGAILALTVPAALATSFSGSMTGARASGSVTISSTRAAVYGTVWDTKADGHCAVLRGNWDITWAPDHGFDVAVACGNGNNTYGSDSGAVPGSYRDFEVRTKTGDDYKVIWQGTGDDA